MAAIRAREREKNSSSPAPPESRGETFNITPAECIRRLRSKGQPILLFGESEQQRRLRLRALELLDERDGKVASGQNEFKKALEEAQKAMEYKEVERKGKGKDRDDDDDEAGPSKKGRVDLETLDLSLVKTDPKKVYPLIYYQLKVSFKSLL